MITRLRKSKFGQGCLHSFQPGLEILFLHRLNLDSWRHTTFDPLSTISFNIFLLAKSNSGNKRSTATLTHLSSGFCSGFYSGLILELSLVSSSVTCFSNLRIFSSLIALFLVSSLEPQFVARYHLSYPSPKLSSSIP